MAKLVCRFMIKYYCFTVLSDILLALLLGHLTGFQDIEPSHLPCYRFMTIISTLSFSFILKVLFQTSFLPKRKTQSTKNYVYIVTKPIPLQTLRQFKLMGAWRWGN